MPPLKDQITFDDFLKLDLRVATVLEAEPHPNADRLLKLQLDLGELGRRQICAGVRQFYDPQALVGRQIIVVANLAPRKIRGEESNGMLLAASHLETPPPVELEDADGESPAAASEPQLKDVILLNVDRPVPPGSTVG